MAFILVGFQSDDRASQQIDNLINFIQKRDAPVQWNRYETKNFEILSIDDAQGKFLLDHIEYIKTWIFWRWGIQDVEMIKRCKIMLVPEKELFTRLFNKDKSLNNLENIWICTAEKRWFTNSLPKSLTEVMLNLFEIKYNLSVGVWAHRGMSLLNGNINEIKIISSNKISSKKVFSLKKEEYKNLSESEKISFDSQAALICLFICKEQGVDKFLDYLSSNRYADDYSSLDASVEKMLTMLATKPNSYFNIK